MNKKIKIALCAVVLALGLNVSPIAPVSARADPTGCSTGQMLGSVSGSLGCMVNGSLGSINLTGATVPTDGWYLSTTHTPSLSVNGTKYLTMETVGGQPEAIFGDTIGGSSTSWFFKASSGNIGSITCTYGDACNISALSGTNFLVLKANGNPFLAGDGSWTRIEGAVTIGANATKVANNGEIAFVGTIPAVTGTGTPTIATGSTDTLGEITSGTSATSVVITFANAKTNAPFCTVTPQTQLLAFQYTISTTAITITQTATTGEKIDYFCGQH